MTNADKIRFHEELEKKYGTLQLNAGKNILVQVGVNSLLTDGYAEAVKAKHESDTAACGGIPIMTVEFYNAAVDAAVEMAKWGYDIGLNHLQDILPNNCVEYLVDLDDEDEEIDIGDVDGWNVTNVTTGKTVHVTKEDIDKE